MPITMKFSPMIQDKPVAHIDLAPDESCPLVEGDEVIVTVLFPGFWEIAYPEDLRAPVNQLVLGAFLWPLPKSEMYEGIPYDRGGDDLFSDIYCKRVNQRRIARFTYDTWGGKFLAIVPTIDEPELPRDPTDALLLDIPCFVESAEFRPIYFGQQQDYCDVTLVPIGSQQDGLIVCHNIEVRPYER